jgi:NAD(P)-dependent dehydrogenase (short-subunit alcohol dehydrogenase family)
MRGLDGKIALVTGAGSGIGAATAARLGEEGAVVIGLDLTVSTDHGCKEFSAVDVTDADAVTACVDGIVSSHGSLDVVVNAAGVAGGGPLHAIELDEWNRVIAVNLTGTMLVCRAATNHMLRAGSGAIVNIASVEGLEGGEGGSAYNASKGGVVLLTKNLAMDYGRRGIRVNAVCPGFIQTPMMDATLGDDAMAGIREQFREAHQLGRFGDPSEIASAIAFLASDDASFVTGTTLTVDGGMMAGHRVGISELLGLA